MTYLRPNEIAQKLGTSNSFVNRVIGWSKCREQKSDGEKTLFSYEDIVEFIRTKKDLSFDKK
jgi:hypothetical protein